MCRARRSDCAGDIDLLLVSHAHIDHVAAVPYLTEKTAFKGRVFMTHPSKAVMRMLISDYLRILPLSSFSRSSIRSVLAGSMESMPAECSRAHSGSRRCPVRLLCRSKTGLCDSPSVATSFSTMQTDRC